MDLQNQMEMIYQNLPLDRIPWNLEIPPKLLVELVESERVLPFEAVDLGCGAGNYAVWFASRGFRITGIDIFPKAIELAGQLAIKKGVECSFMAADLTRDPMVTDRAFDFAYDWEVLHHVFPEDREKYVDNIQRLLRQGGRYFSVCLSEEDSDLGGEGKYRKTPLGTTLYFSSEKELRALFEPRFRIDDLCTSEIAGKYGPHKVVVAMMQRE